jgi:hypothetical protein
MSASDPIERLHQPIRRDQKVPSPEERRLTWLKLTSMHHLTIE